MEKRTVFMDLNTQHDKNVNSHQNDIQFNTVLIKIPASSFVIIDRLIRKCI